MGGGGGREGASEGARERGRAGQAGKMAGVEAVIYRESSRCSTVLSVVIMSFEVAGVTVSRSTFPLNRAPYVDVFTSPDVCLVTPVSLLARNTRRLSISGAEANSASREERKRGQSSTDYLTTFIRRRLSISLSNSRSCSK